MCRIVCALCRAVASLSPVSVGVGDTDAHAHAVAIFLLVDCVHGLGDGWVFRAADDWHERDIQRTVVFSALFV